VAAGSHEIDNQDEEEALGEPLGRKVTRERRRIECHAKSTKERKRERTGGNLPSSCESDTEPDGWNHATRRHHGLPSFGAKQKS
jgi:hypothetical protein